MASMPLNPETLPAFRERLMRVTADTSRRWGKMNATEMMAHLTRALQIGLGEVKIEDESNILTRTLLRFVAFHLPWPKGRIKAPPVFSPAPEGDFESERAKAMAAHERFAEVAAREPGRQALSMAFGWMPMTKWQVLMGKHTDHHLRQFGC